MVTRVYRFMAVFMLLILFTSACASAPAAEKDQPIYRVFLGNSVQDKKVAQFIAENKCQTTLQYVMCMDAGLAFWADVNQIVRKVYLYSRAADEIGHYQGKLPFGLTFYDPMWLVEYKLSAVDTEEADHLAAEKAGLPDSGSSPDHFHYWAEYRRFGMTVIYDTPFADEDAYIYAIVLNN